MELQDIGNLQVAAAIAKSFHHHHKFGLGLNLGAEIVEVADQMVKVDFQHGFVCLLLQLHANLFKLKGTRTFQQDGLVVELREGELRQEIRHILIEISLHLELAGLTRKRLTDANQHINTLILKQLCNLSIQIHFIATTL